MRKRVAMAQNWIIDRSQVLMDEPFSALDVHTRQLMEGELLGAVGVASARRGTDAPSFSSPTISRKRSRLPTKSSCCRRVRRAASSRAIPIDARAAARSARTADVAGVRGHLPRDLVGAARGSGQEPARREPAVADIVRAVAAWRASASARSFVVSAVAGGGGLPACIDPFFVSRPSRHRPAHRGRGCRPGRSGPICW